MKRELWSVGSVFGHAIGILNSIFCEAEEKELETEEKWLVVEQINSLCSEMMIDDAYDIMVMLRSIPKNRLCERTDCQYHHPHNPESHNYCHLQDKCDECRDNQKSRIAHTNRKDNYESK